MKKGIVFVFQHETLPKQIMPLDSVRNKTLLAVFLYDLSILPKEDMEIIKSDYEIIRNCIKDKAVSQRNQKYLHIHTHGSKKNPNQRALGFTKTFLTKLAGMNLKRPLIKKNKSYCVKI